MPIAPSFLVPGGALAGRLAANIDRAHMVGDRIGSYTLKQWVAAGGMGEIWRADRSDGAFAQTVAIKFAQRARTFDSDTMLERERALLASLDHPHIARLLDGGSLDDGELWLAMEWIDGRTLDQLRTELSPAQRFALFDEIAAAVAYAHGRLIVHRDLKSNNVLVDRHGAKLLDFGIAALLGDEAGDATRDFATPLWASPEQRCREPVGTASDIYQLGLLLRWLWRNQDADATAPDSAATVPLSRNAPSLPSQAPDLPRELAAIVDRALAPSPAKRYPTVAELRAEVARFASGRPVTAVAGGTGYVAWCFVRRHRVGVALAAIAVSAATLAGAYSIAQIRQARDLAQSEADRATIEAKRSADVASFLQSVLIEASPSRASGVRPTVDAVLERASERLQTELKDDPNLRAQLLTVLAQVHVEHEEHARALPLMREAVALSTDPALPDDRARRLMLLGAAEHQLGESSQALERFAEAGKLAVNAPLRLRNQIERNRAQVLFQTGEVDAAVQAQQVTTAAVAAEEPDSGMLVANLINLGQMQAASGAADAADTLQRAFALSSSVNGPTHPHTLLAGSTNVVLLADRGDHAKAIELSQTITAANREVFGEVSAHHANALMAQGYALQRAAEDERALQVYSESLRLWDALPPGSDLNSVTVLQQMGDIAFEAGRLDEAEVRYREMLERNVDGQRAADPDLGQRPLRLARTLAAQGKCDEALAALDQARSKATRAPAGHGIHQSLTEFDGCEE